MKKHLFDCSSRRSQPSRFGPGDEAVARVRGRVKNHRIASSAIAGLVTFLTSAASAQDVPPSPPSPNDDPARDIVVVGIRGSAIEEIAPLAELDADAIAAIGAQSVEELNRAIQG